MKQIYEVGERNEWRNKYTKWDNTTNEADTWSESTQRMKQVHEVGQHNEWSKYMK